MGNSLEQYRAAVVFFIHDVIIYSRSLFSDFQNLITCKTLCRLCIMSLNNDAKFWRLEPLRINFLHSCSCFFLFFYYLMIVEDPSVENLLIYYILIFEESGTRLTL